MPETLSSRGRKCQKSCGRRGFQERQAILQGRQPVELTAARLKRTHLPLSWAEQRRLLGFEI